MIENDSRILVPFDATELSLSALENAKEAAVKSNSTLILLYVVDDSCLRPVGIKDFITQVQDFDSSRQNFVNTLKKGAELMINKELKEIKFFANILKTDMGALNKSRDKTTGEVTINEKLDFDVTDRM